MNQVGKVTYTKEAGDFLAEETSISEMGITWLCCLKCDFVQMFYGFEFCIPHPLLTSSFSQDKSLLRLDMAICCSLLWQNTRQKQCKGGKVCFESWLQSIKAAKASGITMRQWLVVHTVADQEAGARPTSGLGSNLHRTGSNYSSASQATSLRGFIVIIPPTTPNTKSIINCRTSIQNTSTAVRPFQPW